MTTRGPRSGDTPSITPARDAGREPTQSLNLEPGEQPVPASAAELAALAALALGTHNRQITAIESPGGRGKTPAPPGGARLPAVPNRQPDAPEEYLDQVLGSYRVIELLGKGGMGYVYRAEHIKLGREVALKLLRRDYASRRDSVARFFQEARTVNRIRHRNIVDVTDFVELDDGTTFIIMELLTGTSLGGWAQRGVDLPRALAVLVQICDGLGAAHQVDVVHRDLKPDNVIVVPTPDGADLVKLLDFGVAKLLNREDEDVGFQTAAGSVIGTPAYMSPEQAGGMVIDARSDIYSLGAIMYELFCGQPMFRGRSFGEFVRKHLTEMPVPPRQTPGGAGIDPQLEAVILKSLEKDPEQRFSHIVELREALLNLLGGMGIPLGGTYPPGALVMTSSGIRPPALQLPLPAPVSGISHVSGTSHPSHISGSGELDMSQIQLDVRYRPTPRPAPAATTPWWVWAGGAVVAVSLGVSAAIWYAERSKGAPAPPTATALAQPAASAAPAVQPIVEPAVQPIVEPAAQPVAPPVAHGTVIEVRFDSLPSGGVYATGRPTELCRTPCAFNIDLADGGPTDHRDFVVKRDGYADGPITVDLTADKREFQVMLARAAQAAPAAPHDGRPLDAQADPKRDKRPTKRPLKVTGRDSKAGKASHDAPEARDARDAKDADHDHLIDPSDGQPSPPKKPPSKPAIDPSDTLDPFHPKP